jgi:hypothetical protein
MMQPIRKPPRAIVGPKVIADYKPLLLSHADSLGAAV